MLLGEKSFLSRKSKRYMGKYFFCNIIQPDTHKANKSYKITPNQQSNDT